jgi:glycosyltransferase involved in cell wall biosynthesis
MAENEEQTEVTSADEQAGSVVDTIEDIIDDSRTPNRTAPRVNGIAANGTVATNGTATTERSLEHIPANLEPEPTRSVCDVLVAIPAYNEETTIGEVVRYASDHADQVLVIDDGSEDDTANRAASAGAIVIEHGRNRGYGAALKTAFEVAQRYGACHLLVIDGDGQHDPADIPQLVASQECTGAHLVIGSRFIDGATSNAPLYRRIGLRTINILTNLSMGVVRSTSWVKDTQSGFRAYDQEMIQTLAADGSIGDWMDASTDVLYHAHHHSYTIEEVPIAVEYGVENASSQAPLSHGIVLVRNILKTIERERPLTAIAVPGFGLTFGGLGFGYWALTNYIQSGSFSVGLALTSAFLVIIGILACFTAIVLHSLSTYFSNTGMQGGMFR